MKNASKAMLQQMIDGEDINDTLWAFEKRENTGNHYNKLRPSHYKRLIEEVDERATDWEAQTIRQLFKERYEHVFWNEVGQKDMRKYIKEWHKSVKKLTRYGNKMNILNIQ